MLHVVLGGHRLDLEPLPRAFVLRGPRAALATLRARLPEDVDVIASDPSPGALVVACDRALLERALDAAKVAGRVRIEPAYHPVGAAPGDLWAPTGRVALRVPEDWPRARVDEALGRRGLRVTETGDEASGRYFAIADGDPIEAAGALVEEDGALFAEPDFLQPMPRRAASGAKRR